MRIIITAVFLVLVSMACRQSSRLYENEAVGYAQGTTYQIKYLSARSLDFREEFDSIFGAIDRSMSTYQPNSLISAINRGEPNTPMDQYFQEVLDRSLTVAAETDGFFDPTVGPLVQLWGFGRVKPQLSVIQPALDSIMALTGYKAVSVQGGQLKMPDGYQIDFNAIAQGFTVDVLCRFLKDKGIEQYMVEVGGEVRTAGKNARGKEWLIGIDKPSESIDEDDRFQVIVKLENRALATSGNYRKFWVDEETGLRYAHTIDPHTGMPARNSLLSVSVVAANAMDADAYATAFMAMGQEKAWDFVNEHPELDAYFVSASADGTWHVRMTPGFKEIVVDDPE